ncbi:adenine nucleotide alpha hydrolase [Elizabethkingia sp. JS20170427COW]|uniref:adenine nucleotide alpha hydrolase n=1 Tax=Elizabethkingia sp. JS20170427COW TaxID=2583851 RepID=UPI0011100027|nr:adenine nucleotide alpha hydrolase [Elizabethkingia sp. JS20170427COW]QCX54325.1 adenine nucleotide alpha hydrolase [Elizabethkingia sp. JS20170427COW]
MEEKKKVVFNWSGGKDSALALRNILLDQQYEVVSLLTTINKETSTSSIHAIPLELLLKQAESIELPLYTIALSKEDKTYEQGMLEAITYFKAQGVTHFAFGDIFLEEVRKYREDKLVPLGIEVVEPLWGKTSEEILGDFILSGIKTKIIVTQADKLDQHFIGCEIDENFRSSLPDGIDACGENGEYHTFSYDGFPFKRKIEVEIIDVKKITYGFKLDTGEIKTYEYWQAQLSE